MANTLTALEQKILVRALPFLREQVPASALINMDYSNDAREKGSSIDIEVASASSTYDITPSATHSDAGDSTPTVVTINLNKHKGSSFKLTDKERAEIDTSVHYLPPKVESAMSALADQVSNDVFSDYKTIYQAVGDASLQAFVNANDRTATKDATKVVAKLNSTLGPRSRRWGVVTEEVAAEMLALPQFANAEKRGNGLVVNSGEIGNQYGIDWYQHSHIATHTAGVLGGSPAASAQASAGATTVAVSGAAASGTVKVGDIVSFAGHNQTYTVTADATASSGAITIAISPSLKETVANGAVVTQYGSHKVQLVAERDAIGGASRVLSMGDGGSLPTQIDVQSGLAIRLENVRQNKQNKWEFDVLYGHKIVRHEKILRLVTTI